MIKRIEKKLEKWLRELADFWLAVFKEILGGETE
jgi:hypothetical protein